MICLPVFVLALCVSLVHPENTLLWFRYSTLQEAWRHLRLHVVFVAFACFTLMPVILRLYLIRFSFVGVSITYTPNSCVIELSEDMVRCNSEIIHLKIRLEQMLQHYAYDGL